MTNPWMLGSKALEFITNLLSKGATILELGSGEGTAVLARRFTMHSIEHDPEWINRYDSHYIYAPLRDGWYCRHLLNGRIPAYDLLLIDGPPSHCDPYGRLAMMQHLDLFDLSRHIVIDDVNREVCLLLAQAIALECKRPLTLLDENDGRQVGIIPAYGLAD